MANLLSSENASRRVFVTLDQIGRQLAGEGHQPGGGIAPTLLATIDHLGSALSKTPGDIGGFHSTIELLGELLDDVGFLHAHEGLSFGLMA